MIDFKSGWRKDEFDVRDYLVKTRLVKELPDEIDLSKWNPKVGDQGGEGSCVGWGAAGPFSALVIKYGIVLNPMWMSPRWLYEGAQEEGGYQGEEGAYPRDAFDFALDWGVCPWQFWPYKEWVDDEIDPLADKTRVAEAKKFPVVEYHRCVDGVEGIMTALANGDWVSIGCPWYGTWMGTDSQGKLSKITKNTSIAGGHETFLYGYSRKTNYLYGQNSWSEDWGLKGRYFMPMQAIDIMKKWHGGYDAHVVTVNWGTQPTPPAPAKKEMHFYTDGTWETDK